MFGYMIHAFKPLHLDYLLITFYLCVGGYLPVLQHEQDVFLFVSVLSMWACVPSYGCI